LWHGTFFLKEIQMNMKMIGGLLVVIVVVIAIGISTVVQNVDGIVKGLIEEIGTEITGTKVTVREVVISLTDGKGTIRGLKIANPSGFSKANIFEIDEISLDIDPTSLTGPVYVIDEVLLDGARVLAEQLGTTTNVEAIMQSVESSGSEQAGAANTGDKDSNDSTSADIELMVSKFSFVNSSARLISNEFGEQALEIPGIRLTNLGSRENGRSPDELATEVIAAFTVEIENAVKDKMAKLIEDAAMKAANDAIDANLSTADKEKINVLKSLFKKK
jgi:hypothetical protein